MRPLLRCLARPMKDEWKMRPYLGVLPRVLSALRWHHYSVRLSATRARRACVLIVVGLLPRIFSAL